MLELARTVRFCLRDPNGRRPDGRSGEPRHNTFSAWPTMHGLGRYYQLQVHCRGEADPVTGYFMNITTIDQAVREHALSVFDDLLREHAGGDDVPLGSLMQHLVRRLQPALHDTLVRLDLDLTPFLQLSMEGLDMGHVTLRQQFEFAAAHRLHVAELSDAENRKVFGKCNNPSGHGHNYRLEVSVRAPVDDAGQVLSAAELDQIVDQHVIQALDHKHLNLDVPAFASLNPSVENIARVIYGMLTPAIAERGLALASVSVWETSKTVCTYAGP